MDMCVRTGRLDCNSSHWHSLAVIAEGVEGTDPGCPIKMGPKHQWVNGKSLSGSRRNESIKRLITDVNFELLLWGNHRTISRWLLKQGSHQPRAGQIPSRSEKRLPFPGFPLPGGRGVITGSCEHLSTEAESRPTVENTHCKLYVLTSFGNLQEIFLSPTQENPLKELSL